jgi:hypothetical protein
LARFSPILHVPWPRTGINLPEGKLSVLIVCISI